MGEAWSDWYAMDFLVNAGPPDATPRHAPTIVLVRSTSAPAPTSIRTEPLDCPVGGTLARPAPAARPGTGRLHLRRLRPDHRRPRGARRRRDLGADAVGPARRARLASDRVAGHRGRWSSRRPTRRSSTCATRSCSPTPVVQRRPDHDDDLEGLREPRHGLLRRRLDGDDASPGADFNTPPAGHPDRDDHRHGHRPATRRARPGITVTLAFQGGRGGEPVRRHRADGTYRSAACRWAPTPKLDANGAGYDPATRSVESLRAATWSTTSRCAATAPPRAEARPSRPSHGPDYGPTCGPLQAIDQQPGHRLGQHDRRRRRHADQRLRAEEHRRST